MHASFSRQGRNVPQDETWYIESRMFRPDNVWGASETLSSSDFWGTERDVLQSELLQSEVSQNQLKTDPCIHTTIDTQTPIKPFAQNFMLGMEPTFGQCRRTTYLLLLLWMLLGTGGLGWKCGIACTHQLSASVQGACNGNDWHLHWCLGLCLTKCLTKDHKRNAESG